MTRSGKIILSVVLLFLIQSFEISAQEKLNLLSGTYTYEVLEKIVIPDSQWHPFPTGSEGLYLAAKGGHNAESHNHNDVGNFIVYADGYPAIIDVGVETYTAKTFSARRYDIWTMQSAFHNLPIINGFMQKNGRNFKAAAVNYEADKNETIFSLEIANAYPQQAKIKFWQRTITLDRGNEVIIHENYELNSKLSILRIKNCGHVGAIIYSGYY